MTMGAGAGGWGAGESGKSKRQQMFYAILADMLPSERQIWEVWTRTLHRWGLNEVAARLLEAAAPVNLLGAQLVYLGQPFIKTLLPAGHLEGLAQVLEDPGRAQALIDMLNAAPDDPGLPRA